MSLQKKNDLIRSHVAVLIFWFIVLFLFTRGFDLKALASSMSYAMIIMTAGALCGVLIWFAVDMSRRDSVSSRKGEHSVRGACVSIGSPPVALVPAHGNPSASLLASRFRWWNEYRKAYPGHADAFLAVFSVMYATPRLPASPVSGGHGGATLIEHSFSVVDTMLQMAPKWSYRGHKNKRGEISFPLLDNTRAEFRFSAGDPILHLAAFAHDIGKVACYKMNPDGSVREVRKNHDIEGAKILRSLPEVMALPWKEQMALLTACEFYHHIGSLPYSTWIDDRARALIELLIAADIATGQREGGAVVDSYEDADLVVPQTPEKTITQPDDEMESEQESMDAHADVHPDRPIPARDADSMHGTALDLAYSVLLEPGRVNGTNASTRIAWKHGEWLYISDARLRAAVATLTGDSIYNVLPHRGNMHAFTLDLMAQLAEKKYLLQDHKGQKFSEKRALYTTVSSVSGKSPVESKFVLVANVKAFPGLENAADCKAAPEIVGCSWGEKAAINKGGSAQTDAAESVDLEIVVSDEVKILLDAAAEMRLPFTEKTIDGVDFLFFEEEFVKQEFPDFCLEDGRFIRKTGGTSGKNFIGLRRAVCV